MANLCTACGRDVGCGCNLIPKYNTKIGVCSNCDRARKSAATTTNNTNADISPNQGQVSAPGNTTGDRPSYHANIFEIAHELKDRLQL